MKQRKYQPLQTVSTLNEMCQVCNDYQSILFIVPCGRTVISLGAGDWILGRLSDCLDEGSVRTLKNYFKTSCREFQMMYWVDSFRRSSDESWTKCPPSWYNYITLYMARKSVGENGTSISGVAVWSYWLKFLISNWKLYLDLYVIWTS